MNNRGITVKARMLWNSESPIQSLYNSLHDALVPPEGDADTEHGELLRTIEKLYHDYYNNGLGNIDVYKTMYYDLTIDKHLISPHLWSLRSWKVFTDFIDECIEAADDLDEGIFPESSDDFEEALEDVTHAIILYVAEVEIRTANVDR